MIRTRVWVLGAVLLSAAGVFGLLGWNGEVTPADLGLDLGGLAEVSVVEGQTSLRFSGMVEGVVWRLDAANGASSSSLAARIIERLEESDCDRVDALHGHGRPGPDGTMTTTSAVHLSCPASEVEVSWTTGTTVVELVVGEAR